MTTETNQRETGSGVVVFGVVGNDIHVVANRILQLCLQAHGFQAMNLGTNNRPQNFVDAALECSADAVLVSSLNGEAAHWCPGFRNLFVNAGLTKLSIYLGGNLAIGSANGEEVVRSYIDAGINRVFHGSVDFDEVLVDLKKDIALGRT